MQGEPKTMSELETERRHLAREPEVLGLGPHGSDAIGRYAGLDQLDRLVEPLAALLIGVALYRRRAADVERAVIAGAVPLVGLQDVEEGLIAWPEHPVGEIVGVWVAALARDCVYRLDVVRAHLVEELVGLGDDVGLAHTGLKLLPDHVIGAVDHGRCLIEQRDLVDVLDLACVEHHLLTVDNLHSGLLQLEEHRRFGEVDADRHLGYAGVVQKRHDLGSVRLHQSDRRRDGAAHAEHSRPHMVGREPVAVEAMMHCGGAEIPDNRLACRASGAQSGRACRAPIPRSWSR